VPIAGGIVGANIDRETRRGFTLVELMIVVVVLGILAGIAIPSYTRYVKRTKTSEAIGNIQAIFQGQVVYYQRSVELGTGERFAYANTYTPNNNPGSSKYPARPTTWTSDPQWSAIGFSLAQPHYYAYASYTSGVGEGAYFYSRAIGDLDGDDNNSTFSITGTVTRGEIRRDRMIVTRELE
jgi:prepilin-type N-terminal cleavage/methylation domain-containing protein